MNDRILFSRQNMSAG